VTVAGLDIARLQVFGPTDSKAARTMIDEIKLGTQDMARRPEQHDRNRC